MSPSESWPALPWSEWRDTAETLHMWTQVVGKVRLALAPMENHWWQVPLYVSCRGLTTSPIPHGNGSFQIDFDFVGHRLDITLSDGRQDGFALVPCSVAEFYQEAMGRLRALGVAVRINTHPVEVTEAIPFESDHRHAAYDAAQAHRFWRVLLLADRALKAFRAGFLGKASPVHFFWGSFDLATSRFSGRRAPLHPGGVPHAADWMVREAYSHEVSSCGFWPGNGGFGHAAFYAYAYPEPESFAASPVSPDAAFYSPDLHEFILPYDVLRAAADPDATLAGFLQRTYAAAADLGKWDRAALER